jgi:hypothetical protein
MNTKADPPMPAAVWIPVAQRLSVPANLVASSLEPTASATRIETVMAVPSAIAIVAKTPAQNSPMLRANNRTAMAPVQGRMPMESASDQALVQHHVPPSWLGVATWTWPQQAP